MVHGYNIGVRYVLKLNKKIDYFDDILPLCTRVRKMIDLTNDDYKIIIFNQNILEKRFDSKLAKEYPEFTRVIFNHLYCYEGECSNTIFLHAFLYSKMLKFFKKDESKIELPAGLEKIYNDDKYFNLIKETELALSKCELTEEELKLIEIVKNNFPNLIESEGFEFVAIYN